MGVNHIRKSHSRLYTEFESLYYEPKRKKEKLVEARRQSSQNKPPTSVNLSQRPLKKLCPDFIIEACNSFMLSHRKPSEKSIKTRDNLYLSK